MKSTVRGLGLVVALIVSIFLPLSTALAGEPALDSGVKVNVEDPFKDVQQVGQVFENRAIYGKLEGDVPIDIYSFTPDRDAEQMISLLVKKEEVVDGSEPILILVDPTDGTEAREFGLPVPSDEYHTAMIAQIEGGRAYNEPFLLEEFSVYAEQKVKLSKDKQYYLFVLDPGRKAVNYAIKFGEGKAWTGGDVFSSMGAWLKIKTNSFAGTSPFKFSAAAAGFFILLLGMIATLGFWLANLVFVVLANSSKTAAYLLVKLQPYSRIAIWIGLWFMAVGGYMFFNIASWAGIPFVIGILFILLVIGLLVDTIMLSRQVLAVELSRKEASLPLELRKKLYVVNVIDLVLIVALLVLLALHVG